jgi:GT2 family glycosyltransferase
MQRANRPLIAPGTESLVPAENEQVRLPARNGPSAAARKQRRKNLQGSKATLQQDPDRLNRLTAQFQQALDEQDQLNLALEDMRELLAFKGLGERVRSGYELLVRRIRETVLKHVPHGATVLVVSKGDPALLKLPGRSAWHFPRHPDGRYAGYYPGSSTSATAHLEALRAQGAQYLLFPSSAFWWFDQYAAFKQHLDRQCRLVMRDEDTCALYELREPSVPSLATRFAQITTEFRTRFEREPAILDWRSGLSLASLLPRERIFQPPGNDGPLPYLERSVEMVITDANDGYAVSEAWRVATGAVITVDRSARNDEPKLDLEWLPGSARGRWPACSIIIPCYNGRALIEACLDSLLRTLPEEFAVEIIVVDDASTDDTAAALRHWAARDARIRILRNRRNLGFVGTCNRGARAASGELLIFLNNDLVLLPGWLPPLLRLFQDFPNAGAVGGKLILPDGTLQEAGGVVFCDGSAMNFGRGETDVEAPLYSFVREVDYCSGALLATPRSLFEELGGFDHEYQPGYYEDTDYCFKVRRQGRRVYYQPESAVVHREGGTAGTDLAVGMKKYQVINQAKFIERWQEALKQQPARPNKLDESTRYALAWRSTGEIWNGGLL